MWGIQIESSGSPRLGLIRTNDFKFSVDLMQFGIFWIGTVRSAAARGWTEGSCANAAVEECT